MPFRSSAGSLNLEVQEKYSYAAQMAAETAAKTAMDHELKSVEVYVKVQEQEEKLLSGRYRQQD